MNRRPIDWAFLVFSAAYAAGLIAVGLVLHFLIKGS